MYVSRRTGNTPAELLTPGLLYENCALSEQKGLLPQNWRPLACCMKISPLWEEVPDPGNLALEPLGPEMVPF